MKGGLTSGLEMDVACWTKDSLWCNPRRILGGFTNHTINQDRTTFQHQKIKEPKKHKINILTQHKIMTNGYVVKHRLNLVSITHGFLITPIIATTWTFPLKVLPKSLTTLSHHPETKDHLNITSPISKHRFENSKPPSLWQWSLH